MTEAIDTPILQAQRHLFSLVAAGMGADCICEEMRAYGWPTASVLDTVHAMLSGATICTKMTATERVKFILAGTAVEDPKTIGGWRLRGRPATMLDVVRAANAVLKNFDFKPLRYPCSDRGVA